MASYQGWSEEELERHSGELAALLREIWTAVAALLSMSITKRGTVAAADASKIPVEWAAAEAPVIKKIAEAYVSSAGAVLEAVDPDDQLGFELVSDDLVQVHVHDASNRLKNIADDVWHEVQQQITEGLNLGESVAQVAARVQAATGVSEGRALTIARTEMHMANEAGSLDQAMFVDPDATKEWLATDDNRTRPSHRAVNGKKVKISEPFRVGNSLLMAPGVPLGDAGDPGEVISCRCSTAYHFDIITTETSDEGPEAAMPEDELEPVTAAGGKKWKPEAHPRGADGKFIEKGFIQSFLSAKKPFVSQVLLAVHDLTYEKWQALKPEQQQHLQDALEKLPHDSESYKNAKKKFESVVPQFTPTEAPVAVLAHKGAAPGSPAKVTTTLVWGKHEPGTVILEDGDGNTVTWNGKKYEVANEDGEILEEHTKKGFYDTQKGSTNWLVPGAEPAPKPISKSVTDDDIEQAAQAVLDEEQAVLLAQYQKGLLTTTEYEQLSGKSAPDEFVKKANDFLDEIEAKHFSPPLADWEKELLDEPTSTGFVETVGGKTGAEWVEQLHEYGQMSPEDTKSMVQVLSQADWDSMEAFDQKALWEDLHELFTDEDPGKISLIDKIYNLNGQKIPGYKKPKKKVAKKAVKPAKPMAVSSPHDGDIFGQKGDELHKQLMMNNVDSFLDNIIETLTLEQWSTLSESQRDEIVGKADHALTHAGDDAEVTKAQQALGELHDLTNELSLVTENATTPEPTTSVPEIVPAGPISSVPHASEDVITNWLGVAFADYDIGDIVALHPNGELRVVASQPISGKKQFVVQQNVDGKWLYKESLLENALASGYVAEKYPGSWIVPPFGYTPPSPQAPSHTNLPEVTKSSTVESVAPVIAVPDTPTVPIAIGSKPTIHTFGDSAHVSPEGLFGITKSEHPDPATSGQIIAVGKPKNGAPYTFAASLVIKDGKNRIKMTRLGSDGAINGYAGTYTNVDDYKANWADSINWNVASGVIDTDVITPNVETKPASDPGLLSEPLSHTQFDGTPDWANIINNGFAGDIPTGTIVAESESGFTQLVYAGGGNDYQIIEADTGGLLQELNNADIPKLINGTTSWDNGWLGVDLPESVAQPPQPETPDLGELPDASTLWAVLPEHAPGDVLLHGAHPEDNTPMRLTVAKGIGGKNTLIVQMQQKNGNWITLTKVPNEQVLGNVLTNDIHGWAPNPALKIPTKPEPPATGVPQIVKHGPSVGGDISDVSSSLKKDIKAIFKGAKVGYWSKPEAIWDAIKDVQASYQDPDGNPEHTPLQILKILDSQLKTKEPSPFETKIVKWAATVKGAAYAKIPFNTPQAKVPQHLGAPSAPSVSPTPPVDVTTPGVDVTGGKVVTGTTVTPFPGVATNFSYPSAWANGKHLGVKDVVDALGKANHLDIVAVHVNGSKQWRVVRSTDDPDTGEMRFYVQMRDDATTGGWDVVDSAGSNGLMKTAAELSKFFKGKTWRSTEGIGKPAPAPKKSTLPTAKKGPAISFGADDISKFAESSKSTVYTAFKKHSNTFLTSPEKNIFEALQVTATDYGMSVMQVLKIIDEQGAKKVKQANTNLFEKKITAWLGTKQGAAYASGATLSKKLANQTPSFASGVDPTKDLPTFEASSVYKYNVVPVKNALGLQEEAEKAFVAKGGTAITQAQLKTARTYTGGSYIPINEYLYGKKSSVSTSHANTIKVTQAIMRPSTKPMLLHRGVYYDGIANAKNHSDLEKAVGQTWFSGGFFSASVGGNAAFGSKPVLLEIEAPPGTPMLWLESHRDASGNVKNLSMYPGEHEMLLAAGLTYKIVSVTQKKGAWQTQSVVRLRVVPEEPTI